MRHLIQLVWNLFLFLAFSSANFLQMLWFGKLPKISVFHQVTGGLHETSEMFNDELIQSKYGVRKNEKDKIVEDFIWTFMQSQKRKNIIAGVKIPIFDGTEIIGNGTFHDLFNEAREEYLKK